MAKPTAKKLSLPQKIAALGPKDLWLAVVVEVSLLYLFVSLAIDSGSLLQYFVCLVLIVLIIQTIARVTMKHITARKG